MSNAQEDAVNEVLLGTARVDGDIEAMEGRMGVTDIGYSDNTMEITRGGLSNVAIGLSFLLKMLDEVAQVHPFITSTCHFYAVLLNRMFHRRYSCRQHLPCSLRASNEASRQQ